MDNNQQLGPHRCGDHGHDHVCTSSIGSPSASYIRKTDRRKKRSLLDGIISSLSLLSSSSTEKAKDTKKDSSDYETDREIPILCFINRRHSKDCIQEDVVTIHPSWRKKDKLRTVGVALVLCLNAGVDPPGASRSLLILPDHPENFYYECWINLKEQIHLLSANKAVETVGKRLQSQYERYQPRARFRHAFDPTVDQVRKICTMLRKNANTDRLLFHYNGHGVPSPTQNGEIWVFDRKYTKYVPMSLFDVQTWISGPTVYVYDCNNAGLIVEIMEKFRSQIVAEYQRILDSGGELPPDACMNHDLIQLGACGRNQRLPTINLPFDLFTCCLTTPVKAALHWFVNKKRFLLPHITSQMIDKIPGNLKDRHSPLGELNCIFVAITDTIAWMNFRDEQEKYQTLFREDLLVASLMRNYMLAERVMHSFGITTVTSPELSSSWDHPLWNAWDFVVDQCVWQLPVIIEDETKYLKSSFFLDQLTALELWLASNLPRNEPPDQLAILLQVLLSNDYRQQALSLLDQILTLGPWSVKMVLHTGFLPILLKLLKSDLLGIDAHLTMVQIWAKIIGLDSSCRVNLVNEKYHCFFIDIVANYDISSKHVIAACYVLANIMFEYSAGQEACFQKHLVSICLDRLHCSDSLMRQWCALCLGLLWTNNDAARGCGLRDGGPEKLSELLTDPNPETRAAVVYALGKLLVNEVDAADKTGISVNHIIAGKLGSICDGSPLVRKELIAAFYGMILQSENSFITAITAFHDESCRQELSTISNDMFQDYLNERRDSRIDARRGSQLSEAGLFGLSNTLETCKVSCRCQPEGRVSCEYLKSHSSQLQPENLYTKIYGIMVKLTEDPDFGVAEMASNIVSTLNVKSFAYISSQRSRFRSITEEGPKSCEEVEGEEIIYGPVSLAPRFSRFSPMNIVSPMNMWLHKGSSQQFRPNKPRAASLPVNNTSKNGKLKKKFSLPAPSTTYDAPETSLENQFRGQVIANENFFEWCKNEFFLSIMKPSDNSRDALDAREWRYMRNTKVRSESEKEVHSHPVLHLEEEIFLKKASHSASIVQFNPFLTHLAAADRQGVCIRDYESKSKLNHFSNGNLKDFKISSMHIVNSHDVPLLLVGSDDGNIRVWRDYYDEQAELVTAWCVIPPGLSNHRSLGLVTEWDQHSGTLFASGNVEMIRLWDVEREVKMVDIPTQSYHHVTSLKGNSSNKSLFVAGLDDGSVLLMDRRIPPTKCCVMKTHEHKNWIVDVFLRENHDESIVSASTNGDIKFWDARMTSSVYTIKEIQSYLPAIDMHPRADLIACGSIHNGVKVINCKGEVLNEIQYHHGIMGQKVGPVYCLAFHPYWTYLAVGTTDSVVCAYSNQKLAHLDMEDLICSECVH